MTAKFMIAENVVCRKTTGDLRMLFDRSKGVMYEMNETASAIIEFLFEAPATAADLAGMLAVAYDGPPNEIQRDVQRLLADFADSGLIQASDQP